MRPNQVILTAAALLKRAGQPDLPNLDSSNFLDYADLVRDVLLAMPKEEQSLHLDFALGLRKLRDDFEAIVRADPMTIYKPAHAVAYNFHRSTAKIRGFWSGNRCSKTQSGCAEVYWTMTGQHPWRPRAAIPTQCFLVGVNFTKYRPKVFEPKYIYGEPGNPLSPMFPETGKWFYSYDQKSYTLTIGCEECAEAGKAGSCKHPKSSMTLFSDTEGSKVLQGGQYALGQLDEQVQEEFFHESRERIKTVPNSGLIITETPTRGRSWWSYKLRQEGRRRPCYPDGTPIVESFEIDQYSAGLVAHEEIDASKISMSESEIECRIYGMHASLGEQGIFDTRTLRELREECRPPRIGGLVVRRDDERSEGKTDEELLMEADEETPIEFEERTGGYLKVWQPASNVGQYVIGVDVAMGLTRGDASCASVFRIRPNAGLDFDYEQVAQYHCRLDPDTYATEIFKLGLYYWPATLVIERNGPGLVVVKKLRDLGCWFMYQDPNASGLDAIGEQMGQHYGITTTAYNKPVVIAMLKNALLSRRLRRQAFVIYDAETIDELEAFAQVPSSTGRSFSLEASGTEHDDRVIAAALSVYAVRSGLLYDVELEKEQIRRTCAHNDTRPEEQILFWKDIHRELTATARARREVEEEFGE
jgi:hypothetical protein